MEREGEGVDFDIAAFDVGDEDSSGAPGQRQACCQRPGPKGRTETHLSVAKLSLAMDMRSSWLTFLLPRALRLVRGVEAPPLVDSAGVEVPVALEPPAAFLAAFSARRFCLDAEGGILVLLLLSEMQMQMRLWWWC